MTPTPPSPQTLKVHGLTEAQWHEILESQGGVCALCRKPMRTGSVIDHDHKAARLGQPAVRGILHRMCNGLLGKVRDNAEWCRNAAEYLEKGAVVAEVYPYKKPAPRRRR
jgi:hypothetical protein